MKNYQEISLLPNEADDVGLFFLWGKVYQQIHLALVETLDNEKTPIGVSFPEHKDNILLGSKLRVFADTESQLEQLALNKWLSRLTDYVHISSIKPVPDSVTSYAHFKRYQPTDTNKERLARRRVKRKGESYEQALAHYEGLKPKDIKVPFIRMHSLSSGHQHCLFIKKESAQALINEGYNSYGLSKTSSVPDF